MVGWRRRHACHLDAHGSDDLYGHVPAPQLVVHDSIPPVNLTATVSGATLMLRWTAPSTGPQPASYRIEFGTAPGQTQMSATVPGTTTTASGILPGAGTFYLRVKSVNTCGTSAASNEAMAQR